MNATSEVINDLNTAKLMLYNQQMLTPEMCIRIGQTATDAINLLKEQKPKSVLSERECETLPNHYERQGFCPKCHQVVEWDLNRAYCGFCGQAVKWNGNEEG